MSSRIAYLSEGRLFVVTDGEPATEILSDFAEQAASRRERESNTNDWRGRSGVWANMGLAPPDLPSGAVQQAKRFRFISIARGRKANELFYALDMGSVGGLFQYDLDQRLERRLIHKEAFILSSVAVHPREPHLAFTVGTSFRGSSLTISEHEGRFPKRLLSSHTIQEEVSWLAHDQLQMLYQSAPLATDGSNAVVGLGPYAIEQVDLDGNEPKRLLEDEAFDFLQPKVGPDGSLYFIRRPYEPTGGKGPSLWTFMKDVLLLPVNLFLVFYQLFNWLSLALAGKPLMKSGPIPMSERSTKTLVLWGRFIEAQELMAASQAESATPLALRDWQLLRRSPTGQVETLASHVLAFDVDRAGNVIHTDGTRVVRRRIDGSTETVATGRLIERVVVVE